MVPAPTPAAPRPVLIYDGDCGFCRAWIARWREATGDAVEYLAAQDAVERFPALAAPARSEGVRFVDRDGRVAAGADAVAATLALARRRPLWVRLYGWLPGLAWIARRVYGFIARHRTAALRATRLLCGGVPLRPTYVVAGWLFPRVLALIYAIAIGSVLPQLDALVGPRGLAPFADAFAALRDRFGAGAYLRLPSLLWLHPTIGAARGLAWAGIAFAALASCGVLQGWCLAALWAIWLSLVAAGGSFLSFQWDALLLEAGLLALFATRWRLTAPLARAVEPPRLARALLLFLLARLMIASGLVKLASGDETWRDLTALVWHYETQPLPTRLGWWAHQAPTWFQQASCAVMFVVEIGAPLLMPAPRTLRLIAAGALVALQAAIAATGGYGYFNLLSIALCLPLVDDRCFPRALRARAGAAIAAAPRLARWRGLVVAPIAAALAAVGAVAMLDRVALRRPWADGAWWRAVDRCCAPVRVLGDELEPLRSVNAYGLFEVMTRPRYEVVIEGSADGVDWRPYEFRWKPGDPAVAPRWSAPCMPRLDWQMWFAALHERVADRWFVVLAQRLLDGDAGVRALLARDPFADGPPPRFLRARRWRYRFTTRADRAATGAWWTREAPTEYLPTVTLSRESTGP